MLHFSLWLLDIGSVSKYIYKNYHKCDKSENSQIHTVIVQDLQPKSAKVANANGTRSKRRNGINCQWNRQTGKPTRHATIDVIASQDQHQHHQDITSTHHLHTSPTPQKCRQSWTKFFFWPCSYAASIWPKKAVVVKFLH